jgi:hypothetical protein
MARDRGGSRRDARAPYAAAFFKMSRAVRGLAGSAFGRAIALCSTPAALPVSARNPAAASAFRRLSGVGSERQNVLAAEETVCPPRTSRPASSSNSGGDRARTFFVVRNPPPPILPDRSRETFFAGKFECGGNGKTGFAANGSLRYVDLG